MVLLLVHYTNFVERFCPEMITEIVNDPAEKCQLNFRKNLIRKVTDCCRFLMSNYVLLLPRWSTSAASRACTFCSRVAVGRDPVLAQLIVVHDDVRAANGLHQRRLERIGDRGRHAGTDRHCKERRIQPNTVGQAEADV